MSNTNRVSISVRFFVLSCLVLSACTDLQPTRPPNILFIMVDDLGPEWISAYGGEEMETPHIDRLAAGGLMFWNAYSMPQCTPTRVTLLTGQYPFRHGWTNHWDVPRWGAGAHFDPNHNLTFVRLLRERGYATAAAGKWQINDFRVQPRAMDLHGFDEWAMWTGYETDNPPSAERYWDPYINTLEGSRTYENQFGPDVFVDFIMDFMHRHQNQPMFIYFPMVLTHTPMTTTPAHPEAEGLIEQQKAMVHYTDRIVGTLVATLDDLGIRENTIILFTTDNGSTRGISARRNGVLIDGGKGTLGEPGMNAPFIVNAPGLVPSGETTDALTDFTDLFPTFLELAGAPIPDDLALDGSSIADVILGSSDEGTRSWVLSMGFGPARLTTEGVRPVQTFTDRVIRNDRYKLWILDGEPSALYDLQADPQEMYNLIESDDPNVQAALLELSSVIDSFPREDAAPRYDPTPPQPWDRKPED